jgi:hypothetical protein
MGFTYDLSKVVMSLEKIRANLWPHVIFMKRRPVVSLIAEYPSGARILS